MSTLFDKGKKLVGFFSGPKPTPSIDNDGINDFTAVNFRLVDKGGITEQPATFLGAAGKLSNIQGLGKATKGLTALTQFAGAGGPGVTSLINAGPNAIVDFVARAGGSNADGTPTMTGATVFGSMNKINPSLVNSLVSSGSDIADKMKNGEFTLETIPQYTRDFANMFKLGAKLLDPFSKKQVPTFIEVSSHPNHAQDYIDIFGGIKLPFRYAVKFEYHQDYLDMANLPAAFLVKSCDRPQVEYETEDINIYNYRTKVVKKTTFKPVAMAFYDDQLSSVLSFINTYLQITTPIINKPYQTNNFNSDVDNGMTDSITTNARTKHLKNTPDITNLHTNAASINRMADSTVSQSIIKTITIYHFLQGGAYCDVYKLINPKIVDMQLDQLNNNSTTEGNAIAVTWAYDNINIIPFIKTDNLEVINDIDYILTKASNTINLTHAIVDASILTSAKTSTLDGNYVATNQQLPSGAEVTQGQDPVLPSAATLLTPPQG